MTPLWGAIPPSSGNAYYDAVNKALGATLKMQPADGNNYGDLLPPLFAADKLPDWINIPSWNTANLDFGEAVGTKFADLTPYLAGDKVKQYPNLAAISTRRLGGRRVERQALRPAGLLRPTPCFAARSSTARTSSTSSASPPTRSRPPTTCRGLGKELTNAKRRAVGVRRPVRQRRRVHLPDLQGPGSSSTGPPTPSGKLVHRYETHGIIEALNWHAKVAKAGYVHPDAIAGNSAERQAALLERQGR